MPTYKGAVFFDVDGTLIDERLDIKRPSDRVMKGIEELKANGYLAALATGRSRYTVLDCLNDKFDCYVSCNGAVAEAEGKIIHNDVIDKELVEKLTEHMINNNIGFVLETEERGYFREIKSCRVEQMMDIFSMPKDNFVPYTSCAELNVNKILFAFDDIELYYGMQDKFSDYAEIIQHHKNFSADINKRGINKAVGIKAVIDYFGIAKEDTYAFGDDINDKEMIKEAGHGIAMTPHADVLDDIAEYITGGVLEDGVYNGLKFYGLI